MIAWLCHLAKIILKVSDHDKANHTQVVKICYKLAILYANQGIKNIFWWSNFLTSADIGRTYLFAIYAACFWLALHI